MTTSIRYLCKHFAELLIAGILTFVVVSQASSQPPEIGDPTQRISASPPIGTVDGAIDQADISQLPSRRTAISEELRIAKRALQDAQNGTEKPPERLSHELELLKQIETVLAQIETAKAAGEELRAKKRALQAAMESQAEADPLSFLQVDNLADELATKEARNELVESSVTAAADALQIAKAACDEKSKTLRLLKEAPKPQKQDAPNSVKEAELEVRLCTETVALRKQQLDNETLIAEIHRLEIEKLQAAIESGDVGEFKEEELQEQLLELDKQESDLQRTLASLQSDEAYIVRQFFDARQRMEAQTTPPPELVEEVEAKRLLRQLLQQRIAATNLRLQQLSRDRGVWKRRFNVINETAKTDELLQWSQEAANLLSQLDRERRIQLQRMEELRGESAKRDAKLQAETTTDAERRWLSEQQSTLQQLVQVYDRALVSLDASRRLQAKLIAEIQGDAAHWTLQEWLATASHYLGKLWNTELANVDDRPITIGKVILGLLLVFCGLVMARMLSRVFGNRLNRFGMDQGGVSALQSVAFYTMLVVFTLTSLRFVNVPLTVFTLLGGAIAIGLGFGSQNIVNNFISGLILLAERPIKVGDLIELDTLHGNIMKIGARSTQIRTGDNQDIIVPNSKFLENNVINLTLGDDKLRTFVNVGVIYGSPTREVARLLERAADEHGQVLRTPRPFVWFVDFGENSLNFQIHFWIKARTIGERHRIESDMRFRIDQLFREAKIVIAFPQRDVHIDSLGPLDVRLMPPGDSGDSGAAPAA